MRINKFVLGASVATFSLFSCINNDYDLSDIDTTVGVNANITIPVQMDEVTLHSVLDLEDGSQIKEFNGEYAVIEDGTFESEKINIPSFVIKKPFIEPIHDVINGVAHYWDFIEDELGDFTIDIPKGVRLLSFDLSGTGETDVNFSTDDVDESIVSIDEIGFRTQKADYVELRVTLGFLGVESLVDNFVVESLKLQLPKGLQLINLKNGAKYDKNTGILEFPEHLYSDANKQEIYLDLAGIDNSEGVLLLKKNEKTGKQEFSFASQCGVIEGSAVIYSDNLHSHTSLADLEKIKSIDYNCVISLNGDIEVENFSGKIQYSVDGINVDPVSMKDIPDVLNQTGTNISLYNPQIYIRLNNPLYDDYKIYATTGLELVPHHAKESEAKVYASSEIKVDAPMNDFCLSPVKPDYYYNSNGASKDLVQIDFKDAEWASFANLGNVLSGEKLPESIDINVVDPKIPTQTVKNFRLGRDIAPVVGTYVFYAPLALTDQSHVAYTDTIDGWNDEDVDAVIIKGVTVNALADTDIPLELSLEVFPIDKNGDKIDGVKGTAIVPANATNEPITVNVEGEIKHLDGIILKATVNVAEGNTKPLKPGQHIKLKDIKAKVSGSYIKEL